MRVEQEALILTIYNAALHGSSLTRITIRPSSSCPNLGPFVFHSNSYTMVRNPPFIVPSEKRHSTYIPPLFLPFIPADVIHVGKPCRYYQTGSCALSAEKCNFAHVKELKLVGTPVTKLPLHVESRTRETENPQRLPSPLSQGRSCSFGLSYMRISPC